MLTTSIDTVKIYVRLAFLTVVSIAFTIYRLSTMLEKYT